MWHWPRDGDEQKCHCRDVAHGVGKPSGCGHRPTGCRETGLPANSILWAISLSLMQNQVPGLSGT